MGFAQFGSVTTHFASGIEKCSPIGPTIISQSALSRNKQLFSSLINDSEILNIIHL